MTPTKSTFDALLDRSFRVRLGHQLVTELRLIEATELTPATCRDDLAIRQDPFSLVFRGPKETPLGQRTYVIEHDVTGPLEVFLVPIGFAEYEAVFN